MPGIFGLIDKEASKNHGIDPFHDEVFRSMKSAMNYEPFYHKVESRFDKLGVLVGWIGPEQNLHAAAPVVKRTDGLSLFVAGFPVSESRDYVEAGKESQTGGSGCVRILDTYSYSQDDAVAGNWGILSGFLVDERRERCLLFNDRLGMERLFLYEDDKRVAFASEAKAILAGFAQSRDFDPKGLSEVLSCGSTLDENSLFRNIRILPSGSMVVLERGKQPKTRAYFTREEWETLEPVSERTWIAEFSEKLRDVVQSYLEQPFESAVSLTGGLDSRMIMACLTGKRDHIPCYTYGSRYRETYDVITARRVAEHLGFPYHVLILGDDFLADFMDYLAKAVMISDGYLGFSGAAELYLNSRARTIAPFRITGNYGGELLRGVRAFKSSVPHGGILRPGMRDAVEDAIRAFNQKNALNPTSFTLFVQAPSGYGRYAIERSQLTVLSPFLDSGLIELIYRMPEKLDSGNTASVAVIDRFNSSLTGVPTDRGLLGNDSMLIRSARHLYREAMFKLEYYAGHGMPDPAARLLSPCLKSAIENLFIGRQKFHHFRTWIQRELSVRIEASIPTTSRTNLDEYVDLRKARELVIDHIEGKSNYTAEIDRIATLVSMEKNMGCGKFDCMVK